MNESTQFRSSLSVNAKEQPIAVIAEQLEQRLSRLYGGSWMSLIDSGTLQFVGPEGAKVKLYYSRKTNRGGTDTIQIRMDKDRLTLHLDKTNNLMPVVDFILKEYGPALRTKIRFDTQKQIEEENLEAIRELSETYGFSREYSYNSPFSLKVNTEQDTYTVRLNYNKKVTKRELEEIVAALRDLGFPLK